MKLERSVNIPTNSMSKIMRLIAVMIMKMMLMKAKNDWFACDNTIVKQAYDNMIKNYEDTIMFLKANRK